MDLARLAQAADRARLRRSRLPGRAGHPAPEGDQRGAPAPALGAGGGQAPRPPRPAGRLPRRGLPAGRRDAHPGVLRPRHPSGCYPIGPLSVDLGDVFGFYDRSLRTASPSFLTVYPRILSLERLGLPSKSPFGSLRTSEIIYEDPSRVSGVRDYLRGDSLRKVNWKVSAALGRLQVKTFEPAITLDTMLVLNLNQEEYDLAYADGAMELAITVAASLANHLAGLRQPVGLISNGRERRRALPAAGRRGGRRPRRRPVPRAPRRCGRALRRGGRGPPDAPRGLSAPQPWEIDQRGVDELGFALPGSQATSLMRPTLAVPPGKGRAQLMRMMETLARAEPRNGYPLSSLLRQQSVRIPWGSTIVVVTWGRAMGLVEALVNLPPRRLHRRARPGTLRHAGHLPGRDDRPRVSGARGAQRGGRLPVRSAPDQRHHLSPPQVATGRDRSRQVATERFQHRANPAAARRARRTARPASPPRPAGRNSGPGTTAVRPGRPRRRPAAPPGATGTPRPAGPTTAGAPSPPPAPPGRS